MEYSIGALAELAGVTTRTLRWYDSIGLLSPCRVAENGFRWYGSAQVDRLRDILCLKGLGVDLARIRECLDAPDFDRTAMLREHLAALRQERGRLERMIRSVEETLRAEERNEHMSDEKKFEAFRARMMEEQEAAYGRESREKYGNEAVDISNAAMMKLSREEYSRWERLGEEIIRRLEEAVETGLTPESEAGKTIADLHRRWLMTTGVKYDARTHRGIAQLYVLDERFTAYHDKNRPGCARFLRDAVMAWVK